MNGFKKTSVSNIVTVIVILCIAFVSTVYTGYTVLLRQKPKQAQAATESPVYTIKSLRDYTGSGKNQQILLAFEGNIYDVTSGKEFYGPGAPYHFLAGTDATKMLHIAGGAIVKRKYPVIGTLAL